MVVGDVGLKNKDGPMITDAAVYDPSRAISFAITTVRGRRLMVLVATVAKLKTRAAMNVHI